MCVRACERVSGSVFLVVPFQRDRKQLHREIEVRRGERAGTEGVGACKSE